MRILPFLQKVLKNHQFGIRLGYSWNTQKKSPTEVGENVEGAGPPKLVLDAANGPADYFFG